MPTAPAVDLTITGIDTSAGNVSISIANIGTDDLDIHQDPNLYIYYNNNANPSDIASGCSIAEPDWTYNLSTLSNQNFRSADSTGSTVTVVTPQTLAVGDNTGGSYQSPIGSIYAYIDYGDTILETDESNNDAYWRNANYLDWHAINDGPSNGTVTSTISAASIYPDAILEKDYFLNHLASKDVRVVDFEDTNGWGYGNFAGLSNDYDVSGVDPVAQAHVSLPYNLSGNGFSQNAAGSIAWLGDTVGTDPQVRFDLINTNGQFSTDSGLDDPGIGRIDNTNDFDRGISTTETTTQFVDGQWLEFESTEIPCEKGELIINFEYPVEAVGFYLMGREDGKNDVTLSLNMADGSSQIPVDAYPIVPTGDATTPGSNLDDGSVQFFGFVNPATPDPSNLIQSISISEVAASPFFRDIISIDDLYYVVAEDYQTSEYRFDIDSGIAGVNTTDNSAIDYSYIDYEVVGNDFDWNNVDYSKATSSDDFDWGYVDFGEAITEDFNYQHIDDWTEIKYQEFDEADALAMDWSQVNYQQAVGTDNFTWETVDFNEAVKGDYFDWGVVDFSQAISDDFNYDHVEWDVVDYGNMDASAGSAINWGEVDHSKAFLQEDFNMGLVDWHEMDSEHFANDPNLIDVVNNKMDWYDFTGDGIDWSVVDYERAAESAHFGWQQVDFSKAIHDDFEWDLVDMSEAVSGHNFSYQHVEWKDIDYKNFNDDDRDALDWSQVDFKDARKENHFWNKVDFGEAITDDFNYGYVDWKEVSFKDFDANATKAINWLKVDFDDAVDSDYFDLGVCDWDEIHAGKSSKIEDVYDAINWKKEKLSSSVAKNLNYAYIDFDDFKLKNLEDINDIAFNTFGDNSEDFHWDELNYSNLNAESIININWTDVDYKKAIDSEYFDLGICDWDEINQAKSSRINSIYKDIDWEEIKYTELNADTVKDLDWIRVNYKEASDSKNFDLNKVDFEEIHQATSSSKIKKVYKDIDWEEIKYTGLEENTIDNLDWIQVNYKEASDSDNFDLNKVDFEGIHEATSSSKIKKVYKDIDWEEINYTELDGDTVQDLDWIQVNYKEASDSDNFDLNKVDFEGIHEATSSSKIKKVYKDIDWEEINYTELDGDTVQDLDWIQVNYKEASDSDNFDLNNVDLEEIHQAKSSKIEDVYDDIDWEEISFGDLNSDTKEDIDWARVNYKESTKADDFDLDDVDFAEVNASKDAKSIYKRFDEDVLETASVDTLTGLSESGNLSSKQQTTVDTLLSGHTAKTTIAVEGGLQAGRSQKMRTDVIDDWSLVASGDDANPLHCDDLIAKIYDTETTDLTQSGDYLV